MYSQNSCKKCDCKSLIMQGFFFNIYPFKINNLALYKCSDICDNMFLMNERREMERELITDFDTYAEYVADRAAKKHGVVSEFLFDALKNAELWDEVTEVTNPEIKIDPTKPAYIVRTV